MSCYDSWLASSTSYVSGLLVISQYVYIFIPYCNSSLFHDQELKILLFVQMFQKPIDPVCHYITVTTMKTRTFWYDTCR